MPHSNRSKKHASQVPISLERVASFLSPATKCHPDIWGADNRKYPASAGIPGERNPELTRYMIPFARRVHAARHRRVISVTAAQSGKTDNILDIIGARLAQRPAPILYVGPSDEFVESQFEPRLMALLDEAEPLAGKVLRGKRMRKKLKQVAGVRVRLASGRSSTALKSDPFALGIVDEYDEMAKNIQGQGDPLGLVEARGETYADFVTAVVSTPSQGVVETEVDPVNGLTFWRIGDKEQVLSPIWRLFQQGTRHHFAWACPHCGEYFIPMRSHLRWQKGSTPVQARRTAYLQCPQGCADPIENHHKPEMIAGGVMIAPGQTLEDAFAERNEPENSTWSSWASGLCSPFVTFGERAERLLTAQLSGEEDKIQTVINAGFGELYTPGAAGDLPEWKAVVDHRLPYRRGEAPLGVLRVVAGVDVQKRSLVYVIRGFGSRGTSWLLDYGYLLGNTSEPEVWHDLTLKMMSPIAGLVIEKVFIDSGFRPNKPDAGDEHKVYEWTHRHSFMAMPTKGRDTLGGKPFVVSKIEVKPDGKLSPYSIDLVHINTDFFKGLVHSRLKTPLTDENGDEMPGAFHLFSDDEGAYEDYARQLVSEVRVLGEKFKPEWVKRQRDNHFLDAEALAAAAAYMLNVQAIPEGIERPPEEPNPEREAHVSEIEKAGKSQRISSIRERFRNMRSSR
jgi:phage terminase large subunit GpA-like protein